MLKEEERKLVIYPYGTTREQMVKEFGRYINVYNKDKNICFLLEKNHQLWIYY